MTPSDYIENIKWTATHFDEVAKQSIKNVGIDHFKERLWNSFDDSKTAKGRSFQGIPFKVTNPDYIKEFKPGSHYLTLNISNEKGNSKSFRKSIFFDDRGSDFFLNDNAEWMNDEYGSKVIDTMLRYGVDVLEYATADEAENDLFREEFIRLMLFDF